MPPAPLPETGTPLLVRTDFTDGRAWVRLQEDFDVEWEVADDYVTFVDDPDYQELPVRHLVELVPDGCPHPVLLVADAVTFSSDDRALLVADLAEESGRTFRAVPGTINSVVNNLSTANLSFGDYVDSVDDTGVYRLTSGHFQALTEPRADAVASTRIAAPPWRPARPGQPAQPAVRSVPARRESPSE